MVQNIQYTLRSHCAVDVVKYQSSIVFLLLKIGYKMLHTEELNHKADSFFIGGLLKSMEFNTIIGAQSIPNNILERSAIML